LGDGAGQGHRGVAAGEAELLERQRGSHPEPAQGGGQVHQHPTGGAVTPADPPTRVVPTRRSPRPERARTAPRLRPRAVGPPHPCLPTRVTKTHPSVTELIRARIDLPRRRSTRSPGSAPRCTRFSPPDALVGGQSTATLDTCTTPRCTSLGARPEPDHPDRPGRHLLVLTLPLRALLARCWLIVSFAATLGVPGWAFTHLSGFAGADQAVPAVRVRVPRRPEASTTTCS
jgi:hypothetical protein